MTAEPAGGTGSAAASTPWGRASRSGIKKSPHRQAAGPRQLLYLQAPAAVGTVGPAATVAEEGHAVKGRGALPEVGLQALGNAARAFDCGSA